MQRRKKLIDLASLATLVLTVVLFVVALFENGFTHDLLLEAGVFLVSAKIVIGNYQGKAAIQSIESKLDELLEKSK